MKTNETLQGLITTVQEKSFLSWGSLGNPHLTRSGLIGETNSEKINPTTPQRELRWLLSQLESADEGDFRLWKNLIEHLATTKYGIEIPPLDSFTRYSESFSNILEVRNVLEKMAEERFNRNQQSLDTESRSISYDQIKRLELVLRKLGLPIGLVIDRLKIDLATNQHSGTEYQDVTMRFDLDVDPGVYPFIANHHRDFTPSSNIGSKFFLEIDIDTRKPLDAQERSVVVKVGLSEPGIPRILMWSGFSDEQIATLREEKERLETTVKDFNTNIAPNLASIDKLADLISTMKEVVDEIGERVKAREATKQTSK